MQTVTAKPFIKWAGGKQALADQILAAMPKEFETYFEPFLGGGSVLLALRAESSVANDANKWLVETYEAIRDDWRRVAGLLDSLPNTKADFIRIRAQSHLEKHPWKRAAYFIYLNKTCFRGLFRVNRQNEFNVPYGEYDRRYYDPENLAAVSEAIRTIKFCCGDFELCLDGTTSNDFVYFDPPYYKAGGFSDFNRYTAEKFRDAEHFRLAALCRELDSRGIRWLLSNSNTDFVRTLYRGFMIQELESRRDINLRSRQRNVTELLISNY
ncbi:MAG: Dam family site-specific DNA-(adenine-N6)-methyltransferase [Planctomycetota bacterium]|nr:MAG: Dam family site-specific DNA-(adenine-N6)-methyltransferase [Planctomycetota bacterium]